MNFYALSHLISQMIRLLIQMSRNAAHFPSIQVR
ncbi:hypothetical protein VIM7927_02173 [Vibrio mangrovi]|uniref:Uncharacterized protein n=1 Tax=Vibrio mangrovi TaxID=474394 RepID=A0A1Y6IVR1_9VIBR|nr:hypothetical protein VIM7927_02173 [Vibrio mangrovi]